MRFKSSYLALMPILFLALFGFSQALFGFSQAKEGNFSVSLDKPTLKKGYTIQTKDQGLTMGLWPETLKEPVKISIQNLGKEGWKVPEDKNLISDLWVFGIANFPEFTTNNHGLVFQKSFDLVLKYQTENNSTKHVYIYNHQLGKWSKIINTGINEEKQTIRIKLKMPYAQIAILEEKPLFGIASWFPTNLTPRDPWGCASNEYDLGTKVRVTNLENNKSFITTIISRGPYVEGRIIDLTGQAFSQIANVRQGLIEVKVEKID